MRTSLSDQDCQRAEKQRGTDDPQPFLQWQTGQPGAADIARRIVPDVDPHGQAIPQPAQHQRPDERPRERASLPPQAPAPGNPQRGQWQTDEKSQPGQVYQANGPPESSHRGPQT